MQLPNPQRVREIQHVVRMDEDHSAEVGDEVTSLCGERTWRMRYKDNPNYLTCGMCALLLLREYRELLADFTTLQAGYRALNKAINEIVEAAEEAEEAEEQEPPVAPPADSTIEDTELSPDLGTATPEEGGDDSTTT